MQCRGCGQEFDGVSVIPRHERTPGVIVAEESACRERRREAMHEMMRVSEDLGLYDPE